MLLRYDLFRVNRNGTLHWVAPVKNIKHAKAFVNNLTPAGKGFCVIDQVTGKRTRVERPVEYTALR